MNDGRNKSFKLLYKEEKEFSMNKEQNKFIITKEFIEKGLMYSQAGVELAAKFLENPIYFCESYIIKIYTGTGITAPESSYHIVYQINEEFFIVIFFPFFGDALAMPFDKKSLGSLIKRGELKHIDIEIFKLWLDESSDIIKNAEAVRIFQVI